MLFKSGDDNKQKEVIIYSVYKEWLNNRCEGGLSYSRVECVLLEHFLIQNWEDRLKDAHKGRNGSVKSVESRRLPPY